MLCMYVHVTYACVYICFYFIYFHLYVIVCILQFTFKTHVRKMDVLCVHACIIPVACDTSWVVNRSV